MDGLPGVLSSFETAEFSLDMEVAVEKRLRLHSSHAFFYQTSTPRTILLVSLISGFDPQLRATLLSRVTRYESVTLFKRQFFSMRLPLESGLRWIIIFNRYLAYLFSFLN